MSTQFLAIGFIVLLGAMLPGPDFAIVTKNALLHGRRAGLVTTLGVGSAILAHMTYCLLGLAIVIEQSLWLFNLIKYIGVVYLIYLGVMSFISKQPDHISTPQGKKSEISNFTAFRQGFLCNLLNPKATLFFLALFTVVIKPETPFYIQAIYALEIFLTAIVWFSTLTIILSHPRIKHGLEKAEKFISKILGVFLVGFGVALAFVKR